jgi:hypothetical protein
MLLKEDGAELVGRRKLAEEEEEEEEERLFIYFYAWLLTRSTLK